MERDEVITYDVAEILGLPEKIARESEVQYAIQEISKVLIERKYDIEIDGECIIFNQGKYIYKIWIDDINEIQIGLYEIEGLELGSRLFNYLIEYLELDELDSFLKKVEDGHWSWVEEMYNDFKKILDKYKGDKWDLLLDNFHYNTD